MVYFLFGPFVTWFEFYVLSHWFFAWLDLGKYSGLGYKKALHKMNSSQWRGMSLDGQRWWLNSILCHHGNETKLNYMIYIFI